ncbi:Methyl-CpG-binding domain-containing protein 2 [Morus notabilis]|uniref:Methyl-CpG-binding domain-containing protein 2 n=2 Tax=Morus notabilis TaxID=981085 RepID=W9RVH4_9ROSA|nr:Methyl-CpG-binding domain-containing protein 2 [Morus notabilis]
MTENNFHDSSFLSQGDNTSQDFIDVSSSSSSSDDESSEDENNQSGDASKQLVLYDPAANGTLVPAPEPATPFQQHPRRQGFPISNQQSPRVLPSVGAFTVQCANCFKWRLIPTKEKYEEIREHILEQPFYCETAREWRPDISCDDPADISQDGSRLWAIDKPNIAQPPPGWQRLLRIRGEGSTKFADVYYVAPSGKRLRSMVEVQKYLLEHPEYVSNGVTMSQFSFQIPKPLQENYVRKRPARLLASCNGNERLEPDLVRPLAWAGPDESPDLQLGMPRLPPPCVPDPINRPAKKRAKKSPPKEMYSSDPRASIDSS